MKDLITCKRAIDYISKKEEGKLSTWKRIRLWQHLAVCDLCSRFSEQNKLLAKFLSGHQQKQLHQLPETKKQEIIERILDEKGKQKH
jgi:hypothetical protein